jgi:hypothetical protein
MATFKQPVPTQREEPTSVTITSASPEIRQAQQPDPMDRITVDAFPDDFNLDDYILSDMSDVWGDMAPQIISNAGYDQTDSKTFQAMSRALTDHKKATQGYTSSWIYGNRKIPLSKEAIKNKTFPGYEATEEGLQQLTDDLVDSFIGTMNAFPKAGAFESLSSDQKEFVLRYTKNANYETASGEQQNELFRNPTTTVGDAEQTVTLPTERYGDLTVTSIPDMTYKSADGFNQMYVDTDQGRFVFLTNDYLNKGFIEESPFIDGREFQNFSRGLLNPETRSEILGSAVGVDFADVEGNLGDYGISAGNNVSLDKLTSTQGILIPVEQAEKLDNAYSAIGGTTNPIKGFAMINGKPTYIEDDSYNTKLQYSETGNGGFTDITDTRNILSDTGVRYEKGGLFDNFTGIKLIDNLASGVSDALAGVEDIGREGSEQLRSALQNEYVRAAIKVVASVSPDPFTRAGAAALDLGLTYDDGDKPSASQVVNVALSGANALKASGGAGGTMSAEGGPPQTGGATETSTFDSVIQAATNETVEKVATAAGKIIDGEDEVKVLVDTFGQEIIDGVADATDATLGTDAGDVIRNNPKASNVILGVGAGKDVSETIVDTYADDIADATGATTTNEIAGVKAGLDFAVAKDQSETTEDALFSAAETYFDEGGTVDLELDDSLLGDTEAIFGDTGIDLDPLDLAQTASEALAAGEDAIRKAGSALDDYVSETIPGEDITQQLSENLSKLTDQASNALAELEDTVSEAIPGEDITQQISEGAAKFEDNVVDALADVDDTVSELIDDKDIPQNIAEGAAKLEDNIVDALADVDDAISENLPEIDKPDFEGPDISTPTLDLMQFAGLLGGLSTGGGTAPAQEEQPGSQYQTQFNFLAGLEPLGMLGSFQKRA